MTIPSQSLNPEYSFLWWLYKPLKGVVARGHRATRLYVFPETDLIVVRMQNAPFDDPDERWRNYDFAAVSLFRLMGEEESGN